MYDELEPIGNDSLFKQITGRCSCEIGEMSFPRSRAIKNFGRMTRERRCNPPLKSFVNNHEIVTKVATIEGVKAKSS